MSSDSDEFDFEFVSKAAKRTQDQIIANHGNTKANRKIPSSFINHLDKTNHIDQSNDDGTFHKLPFGTKIHCQNDVVITPPRKEKPTIGEKNLKFKIKSDEAEKRMSYNQTHEIDSNLDESIEILQENEIDFDDSKYQNIRVKIRWRHQIHRIDILKDEPLRVLFEQFSKEINTEPDSLILKLNGTKLFYTSTCLSQNINVASIIDAEINKDFSESGKELELRVQRDSMNGRKNSTFIKIRSSDKIQILMNSYADKEDLNLSSLVFMLDGEILDGAESPRTLELEGGECIDVHQRLPEREKKRNLHLNLLHK